MSRRRVIFHIDVNSAFLSWTAVKMLSEGYQDIRLVPSVVSGDPDDRRSRLTHEDTIQMSIFEDPKMDYYREWDRKYDEEKSSDEEISARRFRHENLKS